MESTLSYAVTIVRKSACNLRISGAGRLGKKDAAGNGNTTSLSCFGISKQAAGKLRL